VLRNMCGPKGYEVRGEWRKLHTEESCDLHSSSFVRVVNVRTLRWHGLARTGGIEMHAGFWWGNLKE
jgi:hypothetical protein